MAMRRSYHRVGFTAAQSAELWDRWRRGEGLKAIGRVFGKPSSCIFNHIRPRGGIRPAARRRSRLALTLAEREEISRGLVAGHTVRSMAATLGRSPSTVSREIARNGGSGSTGPLLPISEPGKKPCAQSRVNWRCTTSYAGRWRQNSSRTGLLNRSPVG
jgi:DNA-binding CsgD family transcriptional regulator